MEPSSGIPPIATKVGAAIWVERSSQARSLWTISGVEITRQKELLGRYRIATTDERRFVRDALREHAAEHFPELQAP